MDNDVLIAALAGLLHDIGKLEQRARADPWNPAPGIEQEGQPVHATWSLYFSQTYVPKKYQAAAVAGAYHHAPERSPVDEKRISEIVALADRLSAGERADVEDRLKDPPQQMVTIFDQVGLGKEREKKAWHYLPLRGLELNREALFPGGALVGDQRGAAYEGLCESVRKAARLESNDFQSYLESLLAALQRYCWSVPSAYYHSVPDVSLYDHSRMTAALATCLLDFLPAEVHQMLEIVRRDFEGEKKMPQDMELLSQPVAVLIGGDISGIQDFIYTLSSKGAAKTLRGRSFYLQLLGESVLRFVLRELGLPYTNVIYTGGGHFYLLAPVSALKKLPEIRRQVSRTLLRYHGTSLYLAIGSALVPLSGFRLGEFSAYWDQMHADLARVKGRRYLELGDELYEKVFAPPEKGGNPDGTCSVCGEDRHPVSGWDEEHEEQARICSLCRSFIDQIGHLLPEARYITLGLGPCYVQDRAEKDFTAADVLQAFGLTFRFTSGPGEVVKFENAERSVIWALDDPKGDRWPVVQNLSAVHWLRYTVKDLPAMTFDALQEKVQGGFERLGVLRLDVDDLGQIFKNGLGKKVSLARLSTLSFQLGLFFEGWSKRLCEADLYQGLIYAVYAGGDDAFLIGPWDRMPGLALEIANEFRRYVAENPNLHLSAGLAFIGGKYPIYQAAHDAGEALDQAKGASGKASLSFLGLSRQWEIFERIAEKKNRLINLVGGNKNLQKDPDEERMDGPHAIIQILRRLAEMEAEEAAKRRQRRPVWGPWMWQGAYLLTRMGERNASNQPKLAEAILKVRDDLNQNNYSEIDQWGAAARWAQLEIRKKPKRKESA